MFSSFRSWPARRFPKALTDRETPSDARRDKGVAKIEPIVNEVIRIVEARASAVEGKASAAEGKAEAAAEADLASAV